MKQRLSFIVMLIGIGIGLWISRIQHAGRPWPELLYFGGGGMVGALVGMVLSERALRADFRAIRLALERLGFAIKDLTKDAPDDDGETEPGQRRWLLQICIIDAELKLPDGSVLRINVHNLESKPPFCLKLNAAVRVPESWPAFEVVPHPGLMGRPMPTFAKVRGGFQDPVFDDRWTLRAGSLGDVERCLTSSTQNAFLRLPRRSTSIKCEEGYLCFDAEGVTADDVEAVVEVLSAFQREGRFGSLTVPENHT